MSETLLSFVVSFPGEFSARVRNIIMFYEFMEIRYWLQFQYYFKLYYSDRSLR